MITIRQEEDYTVLKLQATSWNNHIFEILYNEVITLDTVPMIIDASKFTEIGEIEGLLQGLSTIGEEHIIVMVVGHKLYEDYNIFADFTLPITPTFREAEDMLFMVKMERELGLDEI